MSTIYYLHKSGYTPVQINAALYKLRTEAAKFRSFLCKSNDSLSKSSSVKW